MRICDRRARHQSCRVPDEIKQKVHELLLGHGPIAHCQFLQVLIFLSLSAVNGGQACLLSGQRLHLVLQSLLVAFVLGDFRAPTGENGRESGDEWNDRLYCELLAALGRPSLSS